MKSVFVAILCFKGYLQKKRKNTIAPFRISSFGGIYATKINDKDLFNNTKGMKGNSFYRRSIVSKLLDKAMVMCVYSFIRIVAIKS